jgi:hypothetical protein
LTPYDIAALALAKYLLHHTLNFQCVHKIKTVNTHPLLLLWARRLQMYMQGPAEKPDDF